MKSLQSKENGKFDKKNTPKTHEEKIIFLIKKRNYIINELNSELNENNQTENNNKNLIKIAQLNNDLRAIELEIRNTPINSTLVVSKPLGLKTESQQRSV